MSQPFIGQIIMFGGTFAPRGWAFCDGQLLPIASNTALFSIIGTYYGGDGRTTLGLPDLRNRTAVHAGTGPGLPPKVLGAKGGSLTETLNTTQLPAHTHTLYAENKRATAADPAGNMLARAGAESVRTELHRAMPRSGVSVARSRSAVVTGILGGCGVRSPL